MIDHPRHHLATERLGRGGGDAVARSATPLQDLEDGTPASPGTYPAWRVAATNARCHNRVRSAWVVVVAGGNRRLSL
ncbi:hypothetical protein DVS77_31820 [Mycolicibacterium moriokaense]|nr:hypothetical protein DVS77_31820 [Mycolicibacterium moriokaense]